MKRIQFYVTDEEWEMTLAHAKEKGRIIWKMAYNALIQFYHRYPLKRTEKDTNDLQDEEEG